MSKEKPNSQLKTTFKKCMLENIWFKVLTVVAILFMAVSFILPPPGEISNSVLMAVGEIFGFAALGTVIHAIDHGKTASITHGNTTIEVKKENEEDQEN